MKGMTKNSFDNDVPEVARKAVNELIERKREEARCKSAVVKTGLFLVMVFAVFLFYILSAKQELFSQFSFDAFRGAFSDPFIWLLFLGLIVGFFRLQYVTKEYEEADEDYEALRTELIERSEELWSEPVEWQNRHRVFAFLEEEYDINLYHKK
jgi:succinate dehydrogenase hydrophobic anchor subunit